MPTLLTNLTLFDGAGRAPREGAIIAIHADKILYTGAAGDWSAPAGVSNLTIDLGGRWVTPGLNDAHIHLCDNGNPDSRHHADTGGTALEILKNA